jgi:hypothetical protein
MWHTHGGEDRYMKVLVGKHQGRKPYGRLRHKYEDKIKVDVQERG